VADDEDDPTPTASGGDARQLAQVVAPLTAVVAVFTSLAVAGVLGQAQRNHGDSLAKAFGFIIGGAALWFIALLLPPAPRDRDAAEKGWFFTQWVWAEKPDPVAKFFQYLRKRGELLLRMLAVASLVVGILWGISALIDTQQDFERPAISASFTKAPSLLEATVTDEGLASGRRLAVLVQVLKKNNGQLTPDPDSLYFSLLGPGADGKVKHSLSVFVPRNADLVRVKAWTGKTDSGCTSFEETQDTLTTNLQPGEQAGCLVLRLPERANASRER
jgi:hypothetical protein